MDEQAHPALKTYLRRLGWALASLPERDRDEIVEETRGHVLERLDQGAPLEATLAGFGPPEVYAARFIDEMEIVGALASQKGSTLLAAVLKRAHRSLAAFGAGATVLVLAAVSISLTLTALMKPLDPAHVGLWTSARGSLVIGSVSDPAGYTEHLGFAIYPLALASLAGAWFLGRLILVGALRRLARKP
jgi:uncharacterized membrane protein